MKKTNLFILISGLILLISNSFIYANNTEVSEKIINELISISNKHIEEMVNGDFRTITNRFTSETSSALNSQDIEEIWMFITSPNGKHMIGEYIGIYSSDILFLYDTPTVVSIAEFELGAIQVSLMYEDFNKISGIILNPIIIERGLVNNEYFEEIEIVIGEEYPINGILTLPKYIANPPVGILVHGSGQSDMNSSIGFVQPFKDIAHGLAEKGIATIRYNKRYYQFPESAPQNITIQDEVLYDVNIAIKFAEEHQNLGDIYIIGHSLGGMLAPKIAIDNDSVVGIISLAGSPRNLEEIIFDQNILALEMEGITGEDSYSVIRMIDTIVKEIQSLDKSNLTDEFLTYSFFGVPASYWISLNEINTPDIVKDLSIPMLFLQGEEDLQVYANKDFILWQELLTYNNNVTFVLYEDLNHFLMPHIEELGYNQPIIKGNVSKSVIEDISNWINNISK